MFCIGEECAAVLGCDYDTLNRRHHEDFGAAEKADFENIPFHLADGFSDYYKKHSSAGKASLRRAQFLAATRKANPNVTMLIWLGKNHLGQTDNGPAPTDPPGQVCRQEGAAAAGCYQRPGWD